MYRPNPKKLLNSVSELLGLLDPTIGSYASHWYDYQLLDVLFQ